MYGYTYTRSGQNKKIADKYVEKTVKEYGPARETALKDYIVKGEHCISHLEQLMDCDGKTIGKYAKKLGVFKLLNSRMKTDEVIEKKRRYEVVFEEEYKKDILAFLLKNPDSNRSEIVEKMQKQYTWLYRYRREWLNSILPKPIDKTMHTRDIKRVVDWKKRDRQFSKSVTEIINEMKRIIRRLLFQEYQVKQNFL